MGQDYPPWRDLPVVILGHIFQYLPRRDKLAFTLVCPQWEEATDGAMFWKHFVVYMDEDFFEPSLIFITQKYCHYIKSLEIGWSNPTSNHSTKWPHLRYKDLTKRAGRFLILLHERMIQIDHIKIFDWYDIFYLRKLSYLLLRFVKRQRNLQSVVLNNANLFDMSFVNILVSCLMCKPTIKNIQLHYSTYNSRKQFDSWIFTNCMEQFYNLEVLTIDCWIFWQFFNKLQVRICKLKELNLYLDDSFRKLDTIPVIRETQWEMFFAYLPRAAVNLTIERTIEDEQFKNILQKHYPLMSFSWHYPTYRDSCQTDCFQCLERMANLQYRTLEYINLTFPLQQCQLKEKINYIKRKCHRIKSFIYNNVELMSNNYFGYPTKCDVINII